MAAGKGFSISLEGLDAMVEAYDVLLEQIDQRIDAALERLALKIIHDAKRLAPIDTGDLEAALIVGEVKQLIGASYIDFGTSPEVNDYAVVQHEGFVHRNGKLVTFTPGEKTRSKGVYNGELPGAKYLERAIKMNEKLIIEELSKILEG